MSSLEQMERSHNGRGEKHRKRPSLTAILIVSLVTASALPATSAAAQSTAPAAQGAYKEERGTLPDGTEYLIRVPNNWNRTAIRDLDFVSNAASADSNARYEDMLRRGYAVAGTMRHRLRMFQYDPRREIANLDLVLDRLEAKFGKPGRVIQYGCSGGGHVTLAVSEDFSDRVDGAVALAAHTPVWLMNSFLDGWYSLKALIGPDYVAAGGKMEDLMITGLPNDGSADASAHGMEGALPAAWRKAIDIAQRTPQGRARIALAFTLGQWPAWVNNKVPRPNLENAAELQQSMYHAVHQNAANPGGEARIMFENAANGQQLSWNAGIDYAKLFEDGNPHFKAAVRKLYKAAGLDVDADIAKVNASPRITASPHALAFWKQPGRTTKGNPKIPVLRLHMIGDYQIPHSLVQGYEAEVKANGKEELVRTAFLDATGHCNYNAAESTAAIETVMKRLDDGKWPSTDPADLNKRAAALNTGTSSRFMDVTEYRQGRYARVWKPD
jgi:hypothetical protein